jgi:hypothetical protein
MCGFTQDAVFQVSSYRYVSLSVSKVRSLERGGVSESNDAYPQDGNLTLVGEIYFP